MQPRLNIAIKACRAASEIINKITSVYNKVEPEIIYVPFACDVHTDHQIITRALQSTFKWFRYPSIQEVLMYETLSETEFNFLENRAFNPNVFVNISDYLDEKAMLNLIESINKKAATE